MSDGVQERHDTLRDTREASFDAGLWALTFAYVLSQFFRSYVAVIAPQLIADFHFSPQMFGWFAGAFFFVFALAQLPVGMMFDRYGVRGPTAVLMTVGAICAAVLPATRSPLLALAAQAGIGLGCAPIFMGLLNHVLRTGHGARNVRAVTTASAIGMAGALLAAFPLSHATASFGWRVVLVVAAVAMFGAALGVARYVRPRAVSNNARNRTAPRNAKAAAQTASSSNRAAPSRRAGLWTLMPACLAMSVGSTFRTSWGGPYLADVFGFDVIARGNAMTVTSVVGIVASFGIPLAVQFLSPKRIVLAWLIAGMLAALALACVPGGSAALAVALICVLFSVGSIHPLVMSQARSIIAPHRLGIGLGLLNSLVFLGIALASSCFGWIAAIAKAAHLTSAATYAWLFAVTVLPLAAGAAVYFFSPAMTTRESSTR